jgi:hypothetical protein
VLAVSVTGVCAKTAEQVRVSPNSRAMQLLYMFNSVVGDKKGCQYSTKGLTHPKALSNGALEFLTLCPFVVGSRYWRLR